MPKGDEPRSTSTPTQCNILPAGTTLTAAPALTTPPANIDREGAFRIPHLARWPGVIRPGTVYELKTGDTADGIEVHLAGRDPSQQPDNRSAASTARRAMTSIA